MVSLVLTAKHWTEGVEEDDGGLPPAPSADVVDNSDDVDVELPPIVLVLM